MFKISIDFLFFVLSTRKIHREFPFDVLVYRDMISLRKMKLGQAFNGVDRSPCFKYRFYLISKKLTLGQ